MRTVLISAAVIGLLAWSGAQAMPLANLGVAAPPVAEQVKVICHEDGRCYRPPIRRPVARWVYGDNNFSGPYVGPGFYGSPGYRYNWWPFW